MQRLCLDGRIDRLGVILHEHLGTGGKRIRARLALGCIEALGGKRDNGIPWAAACELLHNASLIHDDLQDGDRVRRGQETTWVRYGVAQAINAGDLGLMLPFLAVGHLQVDPEVRFTLSHALASYAAEVVRGQADELDLVPQRRLTWDDYFVAVKRKTAALFALPVYGGALLAGKTEAEARALAECFEAIGALFQVQDDVLDLFGDKGRLTGSDLREGRGGALVVEYLRLRPEDENWLLAVLQRPRAATTDTIVEEVRRRFEESGTLDAIWERLAVIEEAIVSSDVLAQHPRLHAFALDLLSKAVFPIAHTGPASTTVTP